MKISNEYTSRRLSDFLDEEVLPALFEGLDAAFPEFGWKRKGKGWEATERNLDARADRVICNKPFGFLVHGGEPTSWVEYVAREKGFDPKPRGTQFREVVEELARRAGVGDRMPEESVEARKHREQTERERLLLDTVAEITHAALLGDEGEAARAYLSERGFPAEELDALPFGYFPSQTHVSRELQKKFNPGELDASGILGQDFGGRIAIPWRGPGGHVETFVFRSIASDPKAKYLRLHRPKDAPPLSPFGLDRARGQEEVLLVEGYFDAIHLHAKGLPNVVAVSGSSASTREIEALERYGARSLTVFPDNDAAGRKGLRSTIRAAAKVPNVPVYAVPPELLGQAKDPDEYVREHGIDALLALLKHRRPAGVTLAALELEGITPKSPEFSRREAVRRVLDLLDTEGPWVALDQGEILPLVEEATGYGAGALEEEYNLRAERARKKKAEEALAEGLRRAAKLQAEGESPEAVLAALGDARSAVLGAQGDGPPITVESLLEEIRHAPEGISTGFPTLDAAGVSLRSGELGYLAARPGHGKTSVLVAIGANALAEGHRVFFGTAEEQSRQWFLRLVSLEVAREVGPRTAPSVRQVAAYLKGESPGIKVGGEEVGTLPCSPASIDAAVERLREYERAGLLVLADVRGWAADRISERLEREHQREPFGLVLLDYLQLIKAPEGKHDRRDIEINAVADELRNVAVRTNVPVLAGCQINREAVPNNYAADVNGAGSFKKAEAKIRKARPELHNLREGGEQPPDLVLGLLNYRADYKADDREKSLPVEERMGDETLFEVGVLKNRSGAAGRWLALSWRGRAMLLEDPKRAGAAVGGAG